MIIKKDISILESLQKIKARDLIYPGILVLFFGVVAVVFFLAMQFISVNINKAFAPEESGPSQVLDIEKYKLVAKKLNISVEPTSNGAMAAPTETPLVQVVATSTPVVALDKRSITIMVKNSTTKKGVAVTLAKMFEDSGFAKPQTGSEPKLHATTTVLVKESKVAYEPLILETLHKSYPNAVLSTTTEKGAFDVTVIIGTH